MTARDERQLNVFVATPLGLDGHGGIDRLNDAIFDIVRARPELGIRVTRIVTRGQANLWIAQFVFVWAIMQFCFASVFHKVDLLHIHLSIKGSSVRKVIIGRIAKIFAIPYVVHLHGCNFDDYWATATPWIARGIDQLFRSSERIFVLGRYWAEALITRLPELADKIVILPNACQRSCHPRRSSAPDRKQITLLGRLGARKGTEQFVRAIAMLQDLQDWQATIAGDGATSEYAKLVASLGMSRRVSIPGWLHRQATEELLSRTDILALPSFSENLPMVILEAFAHGVPVVATPVGAIPEVVDHGHNGLIVGVGDVGALSMALRRLLDDPGLRLTLGANARRAHEENYEIDMYVRRLAALWQEAVTAGRARENASKR